MGGARNFYVYVLFREDGSPFYIGKGHGRRLTESIRGDERKNSHKQRIIDKMNRAGIEIPAVKLRMHLLEAEAFEIENALIKAIGRQPNGPLVNLTDGGEGPSGRTLSESHRNALVMSRKGKKHSEVSRAKMSKAAMGNKKCLGRKLTETHKAALTAAAHKASSGRKQSREEVMRRKASRRANKHRNQLKMEF
jgi:hypothetical protein